MRPAVSRGEPDERPAGARVPIRGPLPRQVREEQHAVAARRHTEGRVDEGRRTPHRARACRGTTGGSPAADSITPMTCHRSGTAWQNACSRPSGLGSAVGRGEDDPRCAERQRHPPGRRAHADRGRRLVASAGHHRRARPQTGRVRGLGRDDPVIAGPSYVVGNHAVSMPSASTISADQSRAARSNRWCRRRPHDRRRVPRQPEPDEVLGQQDVRDP